MSRSFRVHEEVLTWRYRSNKSRRESNNILKQSKSGNRILHFERANKSFWGILFLWCEICKGEYSLRFREPKQTGSCFIVYSSFLGCYESP